MPNTHETLSALFTDIANAIRGKTGGTTPLVADNFPAEIAGIETGVGGGTASRKAVNFYDYDGTLLYAYTLDEAQSLTELPALPSHTGLVCQGWNWSLAEIQAHGRAVDVGAMYITDDGKTRLYITIATTGRMTVPLCFQQSVANGVTVDWGDGSVTQTFAYTGIKTTHTYAAPGDYVITLDPVEGCTLILRGTVNQHCIMGSIDMASRAYPNMLQKVEIGQGVTSIGTTAFYNCYSLASIAIPAGVTSIEDGVFRNCSSLASIVIPNSVITIGTSAFNSCFSLASIVIPNSVTSIKASVFTYCSCLAECHLRPTTPPTLENAGAFSSIPADCIIYVPQGCLEAYQTATNWATYASYMREEPT